MVLHEKESVRDSLADEVYASADLSVSMSKYAFRETEHDLRRAFPVVYDWLVLDGNSRQNLATFCQTWVELEVPACSRPPNRHDLVIQWVPVCRGVSRDLGSLLVEDISRAIDYFRPHALHTSMTAAQAAGFHH